MTVYDQVTSLLARLRATNPLAHDLITVPTCGFSLLPPDSLGDREHEFWATESAQDLISDLTELLSGGNF